MPFALQTQIQYNNYLYLSPFHNIKFYIFKIKWLFDLQDPRWLQYMHV